MDVMWLQHCLATLQNSVGNKMSLNLKSPITKLNGILHGHGDVEESSSPFLKLLQIVSNPPLKSHIIVNEVQVEVVDLQPALC